MNFLGHTHVSLATGHDDPDEVLGVILPDLATMAGVRLDVGGLPAAVAVGVRAHHRADGAFHAQGVFLRGAAAVRAELEGAGLAPGAARAVGHVGWELLLDGTLLGTPAEAAYRAALALAGDPAVVDTMGPDHRWRWSAFLDRWQPDAVEAYGDPAAVAERLWHILGRRPRLRFEVEAVPLVANVLGAHRVAVVAAGPGLLSATAGATADATADATTDGAA